VCDNASIHFASGIRADLLAILEDFGIMLRFLPPYSPELSPVELVFSHMKRFLRGNRDLGRPLVDELQRALGEISFDKMTGFYLHCLLRPHSR
jgi:transposase